MRGKKKVILVILIVILVVSIGGMVYYLHSLNEAEKANERLKEIAAVSEEESTSEEPEAEEEVKEDGETSSESKESKDFVSPIDFASLKQENSDIYGWIRIDDTVIDYPILQSGEDDPDYYADYTVDHVQGYPGAIFTESDLNKEPFEDNVTVIYGHRMKNDTMFGSLDCWEDDGYRDAHSIINIYTEEHNYTYQIAFVQVYDDRSILSKYDCNTKDGYAGFLESLENVRSIPYWHSEDIKTSTDTPMIVLSTCYGDERLLVGAVLTEKE